MRNEWKLSTVLEYIMKDMEGLWKESTEKGGGAAER
jgi:hypothetical protein